MNVMMGPEGLNHLCDDCGSQATVIETFTSTPPISRFCCDKHRSVGEVT